MYGQLPKQLGTYSVECKEMMFYQYLPIKLPEAHQPIYEDRLKVLDSIVGAACCDFIGEYGLNKYVSSYVYLTAKYLYQSEGCFVNRPGWHSDGFMTDDINYIWYDKDPTIFNYSDFDLSMDDVKSIAEMNRQSLGKNNRTYAVNTLLRLNQYSIHKASFPTKGMRTFVKVSFSKDKYDLIGNSHNYLLDYEWEMKPRKEHRNIPQSKIN